MVPETAFVLGGGGSLGAYEVGMMAALLDAGIVPDLVLGSSVGAVNGVVLAADPGKAAVAKLTELWNGLGSTGIFSGSLLNQIGTVARSRTHLHSCEPLRRMLTSELPVELIEETAIPFQCVAACVERAAEHWFTEGPIVEAVMASCAVPGLLPPIHIDGCHYLDGGLVDSVPIGRAVRLGARTIYVLHVGRLEQPLRVPRNPWEVAMVAFEIARRHRFARDMADLPDGVQVHLLPTGVSPHSPVWSQYVRFRDFGKTTERIEQARLATTAYLDGLG